MKKPLIFVCVLSLFISWSIWATRYFDKKAIEDFHLFNESSIKGVLTDISGSSTGVHITVNDSSFTFWPLETMIRGERKFYQWAAPGDSIVKLAYSDTLFLHKNDRTYHYLFRKYED